MPTLTVLTWPGCTWTEVAPAVGMICPAWDLRVLGPGPVRTSEGLRILPDGGYADLDPATGAVLVPGGEVEAALQDEALAEALGRAGGVVGAVCNGALLLARAGRLAGRRCTHTAHPAYAPRPTFDALLDAAAPLLQGATYVDEDVVVDGEVVTAKPWAALRFGAVVARAAGALSRDAAAAAWRYGRGERDLPGADPHRLWGITLTGDGRPTPFPLIQAHVRHLHDLERRGRLVHAGPWADAQEGLVVLRAATRAEAEALAAADPFVTSGARRVRVRAWELSCEDNDHMGALG